MQTWKGSVARAVAPHPRLPAAPTPGPGLTPGARRCGCSKMRTDGRTDGQMDGGGGSRNRGSRRAAAALPRPRYVTMRPGLRRRSPPGPPAGARQREEGSPGAAGAELARRDAGRRARRTAGRGRGLHGRGRRALPPPPRARRPPPGPRAPRGLTDGDPPPPAPRRPPRGGPQPRPRSLRAREPALFSCTFGPRTSVSRLLNWLSPISSPPTFYPLSPPPPTPAGRPLPPPPGDEIAPHRDPCVNRCHLIGPQPIPGFQPRPGRDTRAGGDGTWARSWETALPREPLGRGSLRWHSPKPQSSPPAPNPVSPTLEDFAKEGRLRGLCPEGSVLEYGWWMEETLV